MDDQKVTVIVEGGYDAADTVTLLTGVSADVVAAQDGVYDLMMNSKRQQGIKLARVYDKLSQALTLLEELLKESA